MSASRNPTLKRILREASELASTPSPDYHAAPLESDLFEWHFTIAGPPSPSPFEGGLYHGRIILPPAYPLKPPSFRFLTASGRFEVNREICLSISGHHEETWQPAWGIRTALVAIRSFMDTEARGQLGGMEAGEAVRKRYAGESRKWRCPMCKQTNEEIMKDREGVEEEGKKDEERVPEELRLAYREDLQGKEGEGPKVEDKQASQVDGSAGEPARTVSSQSQPPQRQVQAQQQSTDTGPSPPIAQPPQPAHQQAPQPQQRQRRQDDGLPPWIDKAIYGVLAALAYLLLKRLA